MSLIVGIACLADLDAEVAKLSVKRSPSNLMCLACGKQSKQSSDLRKHIEAVHLELAIACPVSGCNNIARTRYLLQRHLREKHSDR
jgi:uncharacterized Zn-finger protein